ncbi:MAG: hypothetical protein MMC33_006945 [Icmadophila ericetorum]|nr:hypothetical protein [Icmadophila ericetorum]
MEGHTEVVGATGKEMENQTSGGAAEVEAGAEVAKTNGHAANEDDLAEPAIEDTEMKDVAEGTGDAAAESSSAAAGTNGTPKKGGSAKKKSSAVPEHKSKKLNKKKSKVTLRLEVKPGELYLARMKGHQPWPSIVCDEEMLPQILLNSRPITTAQPDGTYKKPEYADGGKRVSERTFPIMFLHTNEFSWIPNFELTPLDPADCKDLTEKGKSKQLLEAYKVAAENHPLSYFKDMLADHDRAVREDNAAREEREAKKASKSKRKSDASALGTGHADEMDVDEDGAETKPKSRKRKKDLAESDGDEEKPAKTPKTSGKLKLSAPKTPTTESATKKKTTKPKSTTKKAAKSTASDDEIMDTPKVEQEKPLTAAEAKEKKEKEIRYYRHKLQKGFLSRDTAPSEEEIKASEGDASNLRCQKLTSMSSFLSKLETYPDLEGSIIRATKIHKVLKAMIRLASIPKDEEYNFKKRSHDLLQKWQKILADDPNSADKDGDKDDDKDGVTTNGVGKDDDEVEGKIGTGVEADKEADAAEEGKEVEAESSKPEDTNTTTDEPDVQKAPAEGYAPPSETVEATA